jgi:hypothetical protein
MKKRYFISIISLIILGLGLGCAGMMYKPSGPVECNSKIKWDVAKEADITFLKCGIKEYSGWKKSVLHYEVGVKNKSDKLQRFRVQFILPEERVAGGGLLPPKGKPPVLAPGKEAKGVYPVNLERVPKKVTVVVKTISID